MARLACTATQHYNPRRNAGLYCHLWGGGVQHDFLCRLCPEHLTSFENDLAKYELPALDDAAGVVDTPTDCFSCGKPVDKSDWHLSITAYPSKDQRKDYWGRIHNAHPMPVWAQNGIPLS